MYPNVGNMIAVPITIKLEIVMSIQVCFISWMNFDYKENSEKKTFPLNPKHQYDISLWGEHDCSAHNKKNVDYYEYPSFSHFMDEDSLQGKWWKEMLFLQFHSIKIVYPNDENMI